MAIVGILLLVISIKETAFFILVYLFVVGLTSYMYIQRGEIDPKYLALVTVGLFILFAFVMWLIPFAAIPIIVLVILSLLFQTSSVISHELSYEYYTDKPIYCAHTIQKDDLIISKDTGKIFFGFYICDTKVYGRYSNDTVYFSIYENILTIYNNKNIALKTFKKEHTSSIWVEEDELMEALK